MGAHLRADEWEVKDVPLSTARTLVTLFHYAAGGSNTRVATHGLFRRGSDECLGVAWWIPPTKTAAFATYPADWQAVLSLSRLVIAPGVPTNAATFLLSRSRKMLPSRWRCLVTYADQWRGHTGAIYKADNWVPAGTTKPERTYVLNGRMIARKAGPKTRTHAEMLALGAEMAGSHAKYKFVKWR